MKRLHLLLSLLVAGALAAGCSRDTPPATAKATEPTPAALATPASIPLAAAKRLPRLVNLGADKCVPCKQMVPVRSALAAEYAGQLEVTFIDVWADRAAGEKHGIRIIPTQIILSSDGIELFRHEGYWPKEEIIARFAALGIPLLKTDAPSSSAPDRT